MARASGSYPAGRWFKSDIRYHKRPVGQAVKTRPFHGCNMGSIPVRVTMKKQTPQTVSVFLFYSAPYSRRTQRREMRGAWVQTIALPFPVVSLLGGVISRTLTQTLSAIKKSVGINAIFSYFLPFIIL